MPTFKSPDRHTLIALRFNILQLTAKLTDSYKTCNYMMGAWILNIPWTNIVKPRHFENFEFLWLNIADPATLIPSFETINVHPSVRSLE